MAFDSKNLDDYVDVATRIADFREQYPTGRLAPWNPAEPFRIVQAQGTEKNGEVTQQTFVVVVAAAYRSPDDPAPGVGMAWEVFPGRTPYTRGSELMNAETSAWGRAILAVLASDSRRGVASREEVRNRAAEQDAAARPPGGAHEHLVHSHPAAEGRSEGAVRLAAVPPADPWYDQPGQPLPDAEDRAGTITPDQMKAMHAAFGELNVKDRAQRLALTEEIVGRKVPSSSHLSYAEGARLLTGLRKRAAAPADAS